MGKIIEFTADVSGFKTGEVREVSRSFYRFLIESGRGKDPEATVVPKTKKK